MSAASETAKELALFFAMWRSKCGHPERTRDLRATGGRVECERCGGALVRVVTP